MKRIFKMLWAAGALSVVLMPVLLLLASSGCATSAKQAAYKSLATVGYSVDAAMKAAADLKVAGKISDTDWGKIAQAHERYRLAYGAAIVAAKLDYSTISPVELTGLAQAVLDAIAPFLTDSNLKTQTN